MTLFLLAVARLRLLALALLAFTISVNAREESLFTTSVSYCEPPESLLIQQFDIAYFAANSSISFNISAASVEPNVNVSANLFVNVYGMHPFNLTVDLCSLAHGALCPLPMYNFIGEDSIPLTRYLDVSSYIPAIAYKIPDLEAFVQLTLIEVGTGDVKACVQATLSNGWTTNEPAVEWATGAVAFLAFISALWQSRKPDSIAPHRFIDIVYLFQAIAASGLLNLNYPIVYRSFTFNFRWALGFFLPPTVQTAINDMRNRTGGHLDNDAGNALALTNRKASPYNALNNLPTVRIASFMEGAVFYRSEDAIGTAHLNDTVVLAATDVQTVTSANTIKQGIPIWLTTIGIPEENAFMNVFFVTLILFGAAFAIVGITYLVLRLLRNAGLGGSERFASVEFNRTAFVKTWLLRLTLIVAFPVVTFSFFQWTLKDSWLSVLLSVILLLPVIGFIGYSTFLAFRCSDFDAWPYHAPLWGQYRSERHWYFIPLLVALLAKSVFIAFGQAHGEMQVIVLVILEGLLFISIIVLKPYQTRKADILAGYLAVVRLVCTGLMIAFLPSLGVKAIPRVAVGIVTAVIFSITVIVMFFNTVWNILQPLISRKHHIASPSDSFDSPALEKGDASPSSHSE
ncbi:TRP-domain-containing protein [Thelephora terrestris]|uniref:TRP-domain-containing protein n=1 Tax=Thelephora terrestris TaxID=56493 RepID=A0A9P6HUK0_9AGAM|nr:TRP-domain-containing protein [Thelephora terrestris]